MIMCCLLQYELLFKRVVTGFYFSFFFTQNCHMGKTFNVIIQFFFLDLAAMLLRHQLVRELCESIIPALMVSNQGKLCIGPDKDSLCTYDCIYFLTKQLKHVFWVLKRTVSLRRFF